jgi:hypothetical protein
MEIATANKNRIRLRSGIYKAPARSRITNGSALLPSVDGRSLWVRRFRDTLALHLQDLGGPENVSVAETAIARRCACLIVELEQLEQKFAIAGEASPMQLMLYQRCSNTLRRLLESLGLQRRSRDVTPTIEQYSQQVRARVIDANDADEED